MRISDGGSDLCASDLSSHRFRLPPRRTIGSSWVASAFKVEDGGVRPAVLVIADQRARCIGRKRGLARPRSTKEDRSIAVRANVGRTVHRYDTRRSEEHTPELHSLMGISYAVFRLQKKNQLPIDNKT